MAAIVSIFLMACPALAIDKACISNSTLLVNGTMYITVDGNQTVLETAIPEYCPSGCDYALAACKAASPFNVWIFGALSIIGFFLMFQRQDMISNLMGAIVVMFVGAYVLSTGIDFSGFGVVSSYSSPLLNSAATYFIAVLFIGLAIYRMSMAYINRPQMGH
jgi:hypothetical protein